MSIRLLVRPTAIWLATLLAIALSLGSCSLVTGNDFPGAITLLNRTGKSLAYVAVELETSGRVDPVPRFEIGPDQKRLVRPGASAAVPGATIWGYDEGKDVVFFLYEVTDGEANYEGGLLVTNQELRDRHFRVEISRLPWAD